MLCLEWAFIWVWRTVESTSHSQFPTRQIHPTSCQTRSQDRTIDLGPKRLVAGNLFFSSIIFPCLSGYIYGRKLLPIYEICTTTIINNLTFKNFNALLLHGKKCFDVISIKRCIHFLSRSCTDNARVKRSVKSPPAHSKDSQWSGLRGANSCHV